MNKKIENVEELEASSTNTNKFGSMGTALMLVFMVIAFSAFTQINKKAVSEVCFEFKKTINLPDNNEAINSGNYANVPYTCPVNPKTLCGICFDQDQFPLNPDGSPNLENNFLGEMILDYKDSPHLSGSRTLTNSAGEWITIRYREIE